MSPPTEADAEDNGDEAMKSPLTRATGRNANAGGGADADVESYAEPDAGADREAPAADAPAEQGNVQSKKASLGIKQIEDLENDAMGG